MNSDDIERQVADFVEARDEDPALTPERWLKMHPGGGSGLMRALERVLEVEGRFPSIGSATPTHRGRYQVLQPLGEGASGQVFEVRDPDQPERPLALKLLHVGGTLSPRTRERFRREARALAEVQHPAIVRIVDVQVDSAEPFLVMELVDGEDLATRLGGGIPGGHGERQVCLRAGATLARGLAEIHARGLLHRDLKPANIRLRPSGEPVLVDFGLVGIEGDPTLTRTGDVLGTPPYMAPEQARGEALDPRADLFALGAVLWEWLSGVPPRPAGSVADTIQAARRKPLARLHRVAPDLPRDVHVVVDRATCFELRGRYASAEALALDLEALVEGRAPKARPLSPMERARDLVRRRPVALAASALLVLLMTVAAASWTAGSQQDPQEMARHVEDWRDRVREATGACLDGREEEAQALLRSVLEEAPEDRMAMFLSHRLNGLPPRDWSDPGLNALQSGWKDLQADRAEAAGANLRLAIDHLPEEGLPLALLALGLSEARQWEEAIPLLEQARRMLPSSGRVAWRLGLGQHLEKRYEEAVANLRAATTLLEEDWRLWRDYAISCNRAGRMDEGVAAAEKTLDLCERQEPEQVDQIWNLHASTLSGAGETEAAEAMFVELIERRPRGQYFFNLAMVYDSQCRLAEAQEHYGKALERRPDDVRSHAALAWSLSGSNPDCELCREAFAADPLLRDEERALEHSYRTVELARPRDEGPVQTAVAVALRLGVEEEFADFVLDLIREEGDERQVQVLHRAVRRLRRGP